MSRMGVRSIVAVAPCAVALLVAVPACSNLLGDFSVGGSGEPDGSMEAAPPGDDGQAADGDDVALTDATADAMADADAAAAPTCDAGLTACNASCVNTQSDKANCGACGHDCLGGTCATGVCQAYVVVQPPNTQEAARGVTDGKSIIYTDMGNGIVAQMPVAGGNPILLSNHGSSCGIALGGGKVAMCPNGTQDLWLATIGTPNSGALFRSSVGGSINLFVAMDPTGARVFLSSETSGGSFVVTYCNAVQCSTVDNRQSATYPNQIVAGPNAAYWADASTGLFTYSYQSAMTSQIVPASYKPDYAAIDSTYVYWADTGLQNIDRMPLTGGQVQIVVAAAPGKITGLATDGKYVYYGVNGNVLFAPVMGGGQSVTIFNGSCGSCGAYSFTASGGFVSWGANNFYLYGAVAPL